MRNNITSKLLECPAELRVLSAPRLLSSSKFFRTVSLTIGHVALDVAHGLFQRSRHVGMCQLILEFKLLTVTHVEALRLDKVQ